MGGMWGQAIYTVQVAELSVSSQFTIVHLEVLHIDRITPMGNYHRVFWH